MTTRQKKMIRRLSFAAAAAGLLIPATISPGGIAGNDVCASGSCCRELNSLCMQDGTNTLHYYQEVGPCPTKE